MAELPPILAVFAHPDDEAFPTGGTLAHYARRGHPVYLACATRGEAGQLKDPTLIVEDMGAWRTRELEASCRALGLQPPIFLGYRDSGRNERLRRDDPQALHNANLWEVEAKIRELIAELQPRILITFDPHGGYGHPDHLVVHRAATAAFFSSGHLPSPPVRLFYSVFTSEYAAAMQQSGQANSILGGLDPQVFGVAENTLAVRMNVQAYLPQKRAAIAAHRSQFADRIQAMNATLEQQTLMEQLISVETFALGGTRGPIPHWPLQDLFEGL
jgi:LmbE family N-acetylglucosaminyl deacetylase|uniref:PIG-L family deacetylase n=1 Tax=Meiothermus ruber TaxID=277 RepID=A0A7C3I0J2_MEIRU